MAINVERVVRERIGEITTNPDVIELNSTLVNDLGFDSLDSVEFIIACEEDFELDIPDEDAEKIKTVKDVIEYIERRRHDG